ncbi:MAG: septal ring lytic transglycosylase RlpA family protein [Cytophagales bacterium]|jgi:rare lipoprotein A|nr:septal ring lytic transglycosylase RlpA family protein [Cytophagales bacterium]MCA6388985.1 septal ring lytic transglycosylase RlpA family protein [Cytophagales bacterium]MCA6393467.1 septal ring lytic transglycosylase RlpA family protein [Cytophagales bacterium]MCA6395437.1 septal ring lytic transglycosylase RlpA family protein [Cytophagales bacterium]MCA6399487.1 septal ring lytic transglycosylase RlpA family protein [Cytophagales bacterium]
MKNLLSILLYLSVASAMAQVQVGKASFYADKFEGSPTASGEKYRASRLTAAHKTLPFGTKVRVTNLANNESVVVTINDRGPFVEGRIIDVSKSAAERLSFFNQGTAEVKLEIVDATDGKQETQPVAVDHVVVEDKETYQFDIKRVNPTGYGLQLGTYQELVNVMKIVDNLRSSYKKKVAVQVKIVNGVKYYSIMIVGFSKRDKAEGLMVALKKKFPDSFVVDFSQ